MARRTFGTTPPRKLTQPALLGRPSARGDALKRLLKKKPGLTPSQVAKLWGTTRQNVWNIAERQGIKMAGGRQKWASGL